MTEQASMKLQVVAAKEVATEVDMGVATVVITEVVTEADMEADMEVDTVEIMEGVAALCTLGKALLRQDASPNTVMRARMKREPTPDTEGATDVVTGVGMEAVTEVATEGVTVVVTEHSDGLQAASEMKPTV